MVEEGILCDVCGVINNRKRHVGCGDCGKQYHLTCVGLKRAQADALGRWLCAVCRGVGVNPQQGLQPQRLPDFEGYLSSCRSRMRVLARIPRGAVIPVADALRRLIQEALEQKTQLRWLRLMSFCYWGVRCPDRKEGCHSSLATLVKQQVDKFISSDVLPELPMPVDLGNFNSDVRRNSEDDSGAKLRKRVAAKFVDGDVRGAVRELASSEGLAPNNEATLEALRSKHPPIPEDLSLPEPPDGNFDVIVATEEEVRRAIDSFQPGSAGGPDGLRPSHLKSLIGHAAAEAGVRLLGALTEFVNAVLRGEVPHFAVSSFFGASLCALTKKDGGVRPIAVGNTLRRLAIKVGARPLSETLGAELRPVQLGFSTKGGCEAAVHAARRYVRDCFHKRVLLKLDMRNAFNCLRRDTFLTVARSRAPGVFKLLWQAYSEPSALFYGGELLRSATGIQQGDPFGPALFSLGIDEIAREVDSEFNVWYLDDATLGDSPERVLEDVRRMLGRLSAAGLEVNSEKCELTLLHHSALEEQVSEAMFRAVLPNLRVVGGNQISLLGSPVSDFGLPEALEAKRLDLVRMVSRLELIDNHQAFVLLRNCFAIPKLQYLLRAAPAYKHETELSNFDEDLKEAVTMITNVEMDEDSWNQAALPVKLGGLGCRKASDIALPAFLSSLHSVSDLVKTILSKVNMVETSELSEAVEAWKRGGEDMVAPGVGSNDKQREWDLPAATITMKKLVVAADQVARARLLAAACRGSGAWLNAIPVPSLGTELDPDVLRVAVALRVGSRICEVHSCRCGRRMDEKGLHGLSCKFSAGRHPRHAALNDIVKRALQRAGLPSVLEPVGIDRGDGKRPDGITVFPFKNGKSLVWDCTCIDTFAESHLIGSAVAAGSAAGGAEAIKRRKYNDLSQRYLFEPIAIETTGVYGTTTAAIVAEIGRRLVEATREPRESAWFRQRLGLAIQRGNVFSILSASRESF